MKAFPPAPPAPTLVAMKSEPATTTLILASASPRRRELLGRTGVQFEVMPCQLPEPTDKPPAMTAIEWAEYLACFKASDVAKRHPSRWVLGADTLVDCE